MERSSLCCELNADVTDEVGLAITALKPWPGLALFTTERGTVLYGAPADAFKATKSYCTENNVAMPVVLAAPKTSLVDSAPQFVPEFFLYDFLFVRGAAFKPELAHEKLTLVVDPGTEERELNALRLTLYGPSREELESYRSPDSGLTEDHVDFLARVSEHMAIKRSGGTGDIRDMAEAVTYDADDTVSLFDGEYTLRRSGPFTVELSGPDGSASADISTHGLTAPFNPVPAPADPGLPMRFGMQALGVRGGFDPSGPTTGFLLWVNGRGILFDGPPKALQVLDAQGVSPDDIEALVLSHCHEDHMASFAELVLELNRPRVLTAEPIYRSALQKLATNLNMPESAVAELMDYEPISPGTPHHGWGATFDFFYTVHPIPTLGVTATANIEGTDYRITITGDTLDHDGLAKMVDAGALTDAERQAMLDVIPSERTENTVCYADVGESLIHGHPKDWADNPNEIIYYHCPDTEHTRGFEHPIATPGRRHVMVPGRGARSLAASRLMRALSPLGSEDPEALVEDLEHSELRRLATGEQLVRGGEATPRFSVVLTGALTQSETNGARGNGDTRRLRSGDCVGLFHGVDDTHRALGDVIALTPTEIIELDVEVIERHLLRSGLANVPTVIRRQLRFVDRVPAFRSLDVADRCRLARLLHLEQHIAGQAVLSGGSHGDDLLVLLEGTVARHNGERSSEVDAASPLPVISNNGTSSWTRVDAVSNVVVGRLPGWLVRELADKRMRVKLELQNA
ncbi:MAG: MBL fold metallo-hydrolase [Myxococcota bacterium]